MTIAQVTSRSAGTPAPTTSSAPAERASTAFIVTSEVTIPAEAAGGLEAAFAGRLGEVEAFPGFQRLEVWRDGAHPGTYLMVSWWDSRADFTAYMRSDQHRRSHERIPAAPVRPRGTGLHRYERIPC